MSRTDALAAFVAGIDPVSFEPRLVDLLRLHVFDSIGATFAGGCVEETRDMRGLIAGLGNGSALALGTKDRTSLPLAVMSGCVAARCSEIDDIHLASCVTPGSVIVPAAIAAASAMPAPDDDTFLAAVLAGYEVLVRFGVALDGPRILYRGIWPTYLCTGFGVAATVARMLGLTAAQTAEAFAIVATLATGTSGRIAGRTSRWFTLGCAAQSAVLAVLAAERGMCGDHSLLDGKWSEIVNVPLAATLLDDLGTRWLTETISFKPVCAAKQTIAAIVALRALIDEDGVRPSDVRELVVEVPAAYLAMIDRSELPATRQESIAAVRYQLALAALDPVRLLDVERSRLAGGPEIVGFMDRIRVVRDAALEAHYPQAWPARVTVVDGEGRRRTREVLHPLGDPGTPFGWDDVARKIGAATRLEAGAVQAIRTACADLGTTGAVGRLVPLVAEFGAEG